MTLSKLAVLNYGNFLFNTSENLTLNTIYKEVIVIPPLKEYRQLIQKTKAKKEVFLWQKQFLLSFLGWHSNKFNDILFSFTSLIKYGPMEPGGMGGVIWFQLSWNVLKVSNYVLKFLLPPRLSSLSFYMWSAFSGSPHGMAEMMTRASGW